MILIPVLTGTFIKSNFIIGFLPWQERSWKLYRCFLFDPIVTFFL